MPEGVIQGGVAYVVAAYAMTFVTLAAYAWHLRKQLRRGGDEQESGDGEA